jgi:SAM-dependent methyltransferase
MAHIQQFRFINFISQILPDFFESKKVLEIGSLNINGSVRRFYNNCEYTGIDVAAGPDVDIVSNGENYYEKANTYDVIISCECMEHNPMYEKTWLNMLRLLKDDGLLIMTCATFGRPQHGTSMNEPVSSPLTIQLGQDYYKNLIRSDFEIVNLSSFFSNYLFETDYSSQDLYFAGLGKNAHQELQEKFNSAKVVLNEFYEKIAREGLK